MPNKESIFTREAPRKIFDKCDETMRVSVSAIVHQGELLLSKSKAQQKKRHFILTNEYLYYVSRVVSVGEELELSVKAKAHLPWVQTKFYTKKCENEPAERCCIFIARANKSAVLQCADLEQYETWVICLTRLTLQTNFAKKYKVEHKIGQGSATSVYEVTNMHNMCSYACKQYKKSRLAGEEDYARLVAEIQTLRALRGEPNALELEEVHETDGSVYIISELCEGGTLGKEQMPANLADTLSVGYAVLCVLAKLEQLNIAHTNIRPESILLKHKDVPLKNNEIRIASFGSAVKCDNTQALQRIRDESNYTALEILNEKSKGTLTTKSDVFSLGVVLYNLTTKTQLFKTSTGHLLPISERMADINFNHMSLNTAPSDCKLISQKTVEEDADTVCGDPHLSYRSDCQCDVR